MRSKTLLALASLALAGCGMLDPDHHDSRPWRVVSDTSFGGLVFPESVGCDATEKVLWIGNFGGTELKPAEKDGLGYISKVSLDGKVLEQRAFNVTMNKPKGIWIEGTRLWVADIDSVWIFDTKTRQGRKLTIPGIVFANDVAVRGGTLYVSDNRSDQIFTVEPADFLAASVQPRTVSVLSKKDVNPNGIWPAKDGSLLMAGFVAPDKPRAIFSMGRDGTLKALGAPIGRLDGLYEMRDGAFIATDWNSGSLFRWTAKDGMTTLAKDFKGPADFCVMGDIVFVPDLVKSEVRVVRLGK
jgi:hypothetical protein